MTWSIFTFIIYSDVNIRIESIKKYKYVPYRGNFKMTATEIPGIKTRKRVFAITFLLCTFSCFAKGEPEWFFNWRTVYPNGKYIAQRGRGENAEKARTDALSQIARYFQTTVNANLTTTMQSVTSENSVSENTTVIDEVSVLSQVILELPLHYKIIHTYGGK